jgi:predicted RNase H-like HicB family nuclease
MEPYIALIRKDAKSCFGIEFPDFPGCISAADNLKQALEQAREALALHIEGMVEDGEAIPAASSLEEILETEQGRSADATIIVPAPQPRQPSVRINVTIEKGLLDAVDRSANARGFTRSRFLADAARRFLSNVG